MIFRGLKAQYGDLSVETSLYDFGWVLLSRAYFGGDVPAAIFGADDAAA